MGTTMKNSRKEERILVTHSVDMGNAKGITRDISVSGVYVETAMPYVPQGKISFTMKLDSPWGKLILKCKGEVIRIENRDSGVGLAVRINESVMESDS